MKKIAINGFGRIGRLFLRQVIKNPHIEIVAINDLGDLENLAYLFQHDTVYKRFEGTVNTAPGKLIVNGKLIAFLQEKDPLKLPWKELGVDVVVESTGVFESYEKARVHLDVGAKHVVITAPAKDADTDQYKTILVGVNEAESAFCSISSNGSCTTNSVSPVMQILSEKLGVQKALLSTVHAYTATQSLVDSPVKGNDMRRGRAAGQNIVPSTTGAAIAVTRAIPSLQNKFDGIAIRVPVSAGSLSDITFLASRATSVEEVNAILREAAKSARWQGILKVSDEALVSSDVIGEPYGAIVDTQFTKVVGDNLVKVLSWYDNEWGYVSTLLKHIERVCG